MIKDENKSWKRQTHQIPSFIAAEDEEDTSCPKPHYKAGQSDTTPAERWEEAGGGGITSLISDLAK